MGQGTSTRFDYLALAALGGLVVLLYGVVAGASLTARIAHGSAATPTPAVESAPAKGDRAAIDSLGLVLVAAEGGARLAATLSERVPSELLRVASPSERKRLFIKLALPLIATVNERILAERRRLLAMRARGGVEALTGAERAWLLRVHERYGVAPFDLDALLERVDIVPPSLALAQAAEESGWGTSRFVREGNALFGQRTFKKGQGLVPLARDPGATHEVRAFDRLLDSVRSYAFNLNTHQAYAEFRRLRALQRRTTGGLDGYALARTLTRYSERGKAYVRTIRTIIRANALMAFDRIGTGEFRLVRDEPSI